MGNRLDQLAARWEAVDRELAKLSRGGPEKFRADLGALRFHLEDRGGHPPVLVVLGGTGTGKSTVVNRLIGAEVSATSFRRTFTSAPIAIAASARSVPRGWLGVVHDISGEKPARGEAGKLLVVEQDSPLTKEITLVDTPDLDGDQPLHHAEAERAFRYAQAVIFLVTPEKYQMTEVLPYYRLARRYEVPSLFVMNKCEEPQVLEDFRQQLTARQWEGARVFAIPRDDAAYEPPPEGNLDALRQAAQGLGRDLEGMPADLREGSLGRRSEDLLGRLRDQVIGPLRERRREIQRLVDGLRTMTAMAPGVDVSPVTAQLQRRLQEQSVLYLMGPQRMIERVRQVPGLLMRLPRTAWDFFRGQAVSLEGPRRGDEGVQVPDFPGVLADQFTILQSRIDDLVRSWSAVEQEPELAKSYEGTKIAPVEAGKIADEELAELKAWLEQRWHKTPRDTAILNKLLAIVPGGKSLGKWSEAAPYLLAIVVATHHAFFGPIDLAIIGSFSAVAWIGEKLSNEVASRTRRTNRRIAERFEKLAQEQVEAVCRFLIAQGASEKEIGRLEELAGELGEG